MGMRSKQGFTEIKSSELQRPLNIKQMSWQEANGNSLLSVFFLGEELRGYCGMIHGGVLAGILDDLLARYCKHHSSPQHPFPVTKTLAIKYIKPAFSGQLFYAQVTTARSAEPAKNAIAVKAYLRMLPSDILVAESEAQFVFLKEIPNPSSPKHNVKRSAGMGVMEDNDDLEVTKIEV
jgi:acyl-coenzyme A thioesterase PaaI-like protein